MKEKLKALARPIVPAPLRGLIRKLRFKLKYGGHGVECPFCGGHFRKLMPEGCRVPVLKEKRVVGGGYRLNATCPACRSSDRERLIYLYLKNKTSLLFGKAKILHVAPEPNLRKVLMARPSIDYVSADLNPGAAMVKMDITAIQYEDDWFDVIICNHVLEHVPNDRQAMSEIFRVLKPGGWSILQVPISLSLSETYEDPAIRTPEEKERFFGQNDHVRIYAADYKRRLESAGFVVEVCSSKNTLSASEICKYALLKDENIYLCSKPTRSQAPGRLSSPRNEAFSVK
jgi:SAM-dependent methyltransferase